MSGVYPDSSACFKMRRYSWGMARKPFDVGCWMFDFLTLPSQRLPYSCHLARWCNGSTADSGSVCHGSNPCRAANPGVRGSMRSSAVSQNLICAFFRNSLMKHLIAHHHRRRAATREAFDELDRMLPILRRLCAVLFRVQTQLFAEMLMQLIRPSQRATQSAANTQVVFTHGPQMQHWVKRRQLVNVDRL